MGWLGIILATSGVYLWLRWSPFPAALRYLLPFTFFFLYQYSLIARSYVLFPLLAFSLCVLYTRKQAVVWFAVLAGLLANLSLQGFQLAFVLLGLYAYDEYTAGKKAHNAGRKRRIFSAVSLFLPVALQAIYCAIPAPDLNFAIGDQVSAGLVHRILVRMIGETPPNAPRPAPEKPLATAALTVPPPPNWHTVPRAWLEEFIYPRTDHSDYLAVRSVVRSVEPPVLEFADETAWPLANSNCLACAFVVCAFLWLRQRRRVRMLLPWLSLMAIGQVLWTAEHHAGLLFIALLVGFWLAESSQATEAATPKVEYCFLGILTMILLVQVAWSARCIRADIKGSTTLAPGRQHGFSNLPFHEQRPSVSPQSPFSLGLREALSSMCLQPIGSSRRMFRWRESTGRQSLLILIGSCTELNSQDMARCVISGFPSLTSQLMRKRRFRVIRS